MLRYVAIAVLCGVAASAAQQPVPAFDVVSIRQVLPGAPPTMRAASFTPFQPGGGYLDPDTTLSALIAVAYHVRNPDSRLLGLPAGRAERYAVAAKAADDFVRLYPDDNGEQARLMLRQMLTDRFRLKLHTEMRRESVVRMAVERGGLQVKEVAAPVPPETEGRVFLTLGNTRGRLIAAKGTMAGLATALGLFLKLEVVDETGLKGYYDFDIRWSAPPSPGATPSSASLGSDGIDLLMATVKEKCGLRFSRATGPVEYWIVDHVEPPTVD